jgi:hypothetical protein
MVESEPMQSVPNYRSVPVKARVHAVGAASGSPGEQAAPRSDKRTCPLCKEEHAIFRCETFKGRSAKERREQVYRLRLSLNCLGNHRVRDCRSTFACHTCAQKHHTLLHDCYKRPDPPKRAPESDPSASGNMVRPLHLNRVVLLAIAQVIVCTPTRKQTQTQALLDSGSEITLIAEHVIHQLQLPRMSSSLNICEIGETAAVSARFQTDIFVKSRVDPEAQYTLTAMILPKLTGRLPRQHIAPVGMLPIDSDKLADPYYFREAKIGLILRADIYGSLLRQGLRRSSSEQVVAQDTTLGWVVTGSVPAPKETTKELHRCWETEEVSVP